MFRTFFRSLIVSRPQAKARPQVQRFRPQLEVLEARLAPSQNPVIITHDNNNGVLVGVTNTVQHAGKGVDVSQSVTVGLGVAIQHGGISFGGGG